jgi:predicted dithiol-disulfide oxidoreductase (DUF899 family)
MTNRLTGTRKQWLAARLDLLKGEKEYRARATSWRGDGGGFHGFGSTRIITLKPTREPSRFQLSSRGARSYARGVDPFFGVYHWLDRAPKGRNETGVWWHHHDEYDER